MERRLIRGPTLGRSNRGAPRGARAHKQPDSASDARQRNKRESFQPRADCQVNQLLKAGLFRVSFWDGFSVGCGGGISAADIVEACGNFRWPGR